METFAYLREDMVRFKENKDRFIKNNTLLTDEQKKEVMDFFHSHSNMENQVNNGNWNYTIPYEEFKRVIGSVDTEGKRLKRQSKELRRQNGLEGLVKDEDYIILADNQTYTAYHPMTHKAMRVIASNMVEPKIWCESSVMEWSPKEILPEGEPMKGDLYPGSKWCVAMETDEHWISYTERRKARFIVVCFKDSSLPQDLRKFCFCLYKEEQEDHTMAWVVSETESVDASDSSMETLEGSEKYELILDVSYEVEETFNSWVKAIMDERISMRKKGLLSLLSGWEVVDKGGSSYGDRKTIIGKPMVFRGNQCYLYISYDSQKDVEGLEDAVEGLTKGGSYKLCLLKKGDAPVPYGERYVSDIATSRVVRRLEGNALINQSVYYDPSQEYFGLHVYNDYEGIQKELIDGILGEMESLWDDGSYKLRRMVLDFPSYFGIYDKTFSSRSGMSIWKREDEYNLLLSLDGGSVPVTGDKSASMTIGLVPYQSGDGTSRKDVVERMSAEIDDQDIRPVANGFFFSLKLTEDNVERVLNKVKDGLLRAIDELNGAL